MHAFKTPLHSVQADSETLQELFDEMDPAAVDAARARVRAKRRAARNPRAAAAAASSGIDDDDIDPAAVLARLAGTAHLLLIAIHRGRDWVQAATDDGKLTPILRSCELQAVVNDAVRVMRPLAPPGRRVVLHPTTVSLRCALVPWVITDGHGLLESLLCLMSNALSYSTEVRIQYARDACECPGVPTHWLSLCSLPPSRQGDVDVHVDIVHRGDVYACRRGALDRLNTLPGPVLARITAASAATRSLNGGGATINGNIAISERAYPDAAEELRAAAEASASTPTPTPTPMVQRPPATAAETATDASPSGPAVIIVTVEDRGVGVSEHTRRTLFKLPHRAQRMSGGSGLGLYTLRKRVEALGGDYGVRTPVPASL